MKRSAIRGLPAQQSRAPRRGAVNAWSALNPFAHSAKGWETTNPMREAPAAPQVIAWTASPLQIISPLRRTIILRSFPSNRPGAPSSRRFQPEAANRGRNVT